ncbi:unnamed protein product [Spirodela intermedia]|uniref:Uncharacterized protein n=1 Tax=Spirodela intermedia TaxID=51605 RepID=A0A7I8IC67_SPIIN|nr:unnamed protein product [Spirodela intermedia]CAA6655346.1 unnamed protein product [Spirodela intermedia]
MALGAAAAAAGVEVPGGAPAGTPPCSGSCPLAAAAARWCRRRQASPCTRCRRRPSQSPARWR